MRKILLTIMLGAAVSFAACSKSDLSPGDGIENNGHGDGDRNPQGDPVSRTLFIYMAADNNLSYYARLNYNSILRAATAKNLNGGSVVLYHDIAGDNNAQLVEIAATDNGEVNAKVLRRYGEQDSSDTGVFESVLDDLFSLTQAESYGIIFWSHGTGWMPASMHRDYAFLDSGLSLLSLENNYIRDPFRPYTRAFGQDGSSWMEMESLGDAFPAGKFDFVIFDACYMSGIEVGYLFRDKTKYLMVSPAEVLAEGLPYEKALPYFFTTELNLGAGGVAEVYYEHYNGLSGNMRSATTAVFNAGYFEDLAAVMEQVIAAAGHAVPTLDVSGVLCYDRHTVHTMFDLTGFVEALLGANHPLIKQYQSVMDELILYKAATETMLGAFAINPEKYSGLSVYVPLDVNDDLNEHYALTSFSRRVY